jgi:hypothetical protein
MKYYIQRQLNEYGPYTLADLQRYVAQGSILLTDLARSEGMTDWVPVSQVLGNIPIPVPGQSLQAPDASAYGGTVYGSPGAPGGTGTVYGGAGTGYGVQPAVASVGAVPTNFHWALVLLLAVFTCGLFAHAWMIVEAVFIRKVKPQSNGLLLVIIAIAGVYGGGFVRQFLDAMGNHEVAPLGALITLVAVVVYFIGAFQMRNDLEDYYNTVEPINLRLSGVMTFFFSVYYFQHHLSRIAAWKKTGYLQPQ